MLVNSQTQLFFYLTHLEIEDTSPGVSDNPDFTANIKRQGLPVLSDYFYFPLNKQKNQHLLLAINGIKRIIILPQNHD